MEKLPEPMNMLVNIDVDNLDKATRSIIDIRKSKETPVRYKGSCHCGRITLEVEGELAGAMACNCSMCSRKGSLLWFVPRDRLRLLSAEGDIATYTFNKHVIKHRFCPACGIHPFGEGVDPNGNRMAAINIRCLEGIDLEAVPVQHFDGRSM